MRHNILRGSVRRTAAAVAIAAVGIIPVGAAFASPAQAEGPAVIDPLLTIARFGATFGIPTGCPLLTAASLDIATRLSVDSQVSPIVQEINTQCDTIAEQAGQQIDQAKAAVAPLAFINQFANPAIAQFADAVSSTGSSQGDLIAPFGPTVAGLGASINFFQGK